MNGPYIAACRARYEQQTPGSAAAAEALYEYRHALTELAGVSREPVGARRCRECGGRHQ